MKVCVITTSRADYGIYHSLLESLREDPLVDHGLLVSGSHFSEQYGHTIDYIRADGHPVWGEVAAVPVDDSPAAVAACIGDTVRSLSGVWQRLAPDLDMVVALGDRFEMFAAVTATVPFNLPVAHLHGGETTLGAIDDKFRHAITVMSALHFPATETYAERIRQLLGSQANIFPVGAPSMDGLDALNLPDRATLLERFGIDFHLPTILVTFHPETVSLQENEHYGEVICGVLDRLSAEYQIVITLPNTDTAAAVIRRKFEALARENSGVITLESFGKLNYFAVLKYCKFLLGNSSSALIEAPSFGKFAINIGNRQAGRERNANVLDIGASEDAILGAVQQIEAAHYRYEGRNAYVSTGAAGREILKELKKWWAAKQEVI